jgi:DNA-binding GntR family transcriptional regulator
MAELMGNEVLAQMLGDLISRCALITLMYQSDSAAAHSHEEHGAIVKALARGTKSAPCG